MKIKSLSAACAVLAIVLGAATIPAEAQPFRHHHGYHHHYRHHHRFHHHRFHHRHHGIVGRVARGVARGL